MALSGEQYSIAGGGYTATVTEVGATLRELRAGDRDLVIPFGPRQVCPGFRGALLAPWPNRIGDGRYSFRGHHLQLALSEPPRRNALHGLVTWSPWQPSQHSPSEVVLTCRLFPSTGYPFQLDLSVRYALDGDGLTCRLGATNTGETDAPYGCSTHPYLVAGEAPVDGWTLEVPAQRYLEVTADRLLPVGLRDVEGTELDFRTPRPVGATQVDHAYTVITAAEDGRARVRATAPSGTGVELSFDAAAAPWLQVHTADRPEPDQSRLGLAVEPMTCPPDAFRTGTDLVVLAPGDSHRLDWRITAR